MNEMANQIKEGGLDKTYDKQLFFDNCFMT